MKYTIIALLAGLIVAGCTSTAPSADSYSADNMYGAAIADDIPLKRGPADIETDAMQSDRMLVWKGSITLEVGSLTNASKQIIAQIKKVGGYVESTAYSDGTSIHYWEEGASITLSLRVPSDKLEQVIGQVEGMGKVTAKSLSSDDVTESYIDTEARLNTKKKLRDRLQELLGKADKVEDILAIEKELNRLQADIDSMDTRLKSMKGKVGYASFTVMLNPTPPKVQEEVLGPLGYLWNGTKWCVRKLFVWREAGVVEEYSCGPIVIDSTASTATMDHVVYPEETIDDIAQQYGVPVADIREASGLDTDGEVTEGQRLRIPIQE